MAWHQSGDEAAPPIYDGADLEFWWAKFGAGNGGKLEVCIGDDYQLIMMDARGYENRKPARHIFARCWNWPRMPSSSPIRRAVSC